MSTSSGVKGVGGRAHANSERGKPHKILGIFWQILGILLFMVGVVIFMVNRGATSGVFLGWGIGLLAWVCMMGGIGLFNHGRKYSTPSARQVFTQDKRKPVVYLRSFPDDRFGSEVHYVWEWRTEEEQIAQVMNGVGPFIAIGDPKDKLPDLGAARTYVGNHEWQRTISILSSHAQLVVLRAGNTPGIWWEVERVSKSISPERLLFLIPYDEKGYDAFRIKANSYFPKPLPEYVPPSGVFAYGAVRGIIYFEKDWTPHYTPLKNNWWQRPSEQSASKMLRVAMQPVLEQLQVPLDQSPMPLYKRVGRLLLYAILALVASCLFFYISFRFSP